VTYTPEEVEAVRAKLPELPDVKLTRFTDELGLKHYDADILVSEKAVADYFEAALAAGAPATDTANLMINMLFSLMGNNNVSNEDIFSIKITPEMFAATVSLFAEKKINKAGAETILEEMWANGGDAEALMAAKGLEQVSDTSAIQPIIEEVLANNPALIQRYADGEDKVFGALMGQSMKALKGKGDGQVVREILQKLLADVRS
jgi:aspartyl-tRNA(Asn)/glutamyl-tRNA(Gln) amidotransferase subunit B